MLRREQRVAFEEGNDPLEKLLPVAHNQHKRSIASAVRPDAAAPEPFADQFEDLRPVAVLADMELRYELKPRPTTRVALHRDREAPFAVDVPCDVAIQPFLLIVRTRHVVTTVNVRSDVNDE